MTDYRIVCKTLSSDNNHIEKLGLSDSSSDKANSSATPKEINTLIGNGNRCFVTNEVKTQTEVIQFGEDFITTKADGTIRNNLRHLRDCNFS